MERYRSSLVDNRATTTTCFYKLTENSPILQRTPIIGRRSYTFNNEVADSNFEGASVAVCTKRSISSKRALFWSGCCVALIIFII